MGKQIWAVQLGVPGGVATLCAQYPLHSLSPFDALLTNTSLQQLFLHTTSIC